MKGYVYIVSNRAYPGLVKIGKARLPKARLKQLSGATGILYPFRMEATFKSANYTADEQRAHKSLDQLRVNPRKEFFRISPAQAIVELTKLFGEPKYSRVKRKAEVELCQQQEQIRQAELSHKVEAVRLQRQQEVLMLKQQQQISQRKTLAVYSLLAVALFVIMFGVRWLCFPTQ